MFQFFNFDTQLHFEEDLPSAGQCDEKQALPTTTHSSPGSVKSFSLSDNSFAGSLCPDLDNSFEEGAQATHAQNIFQASLALYNGSMAGPCNSATGFNEEHSSQESWSQAPQTVDQAVKGSRVLRYCQKANFIAELQGESELTNLLVELIALFNPRVFAELLLVVHTIWDRQYRHYRASKQRHSGFLPSFRGFFGFEGQTMEREDLSFNCTPSSEIVASAAQGIGVIADELFDSKKIKILNFREARRGKAQEEVLREQFQQFVGAVARAVFLSAEGVFEEETMEVEVGSFSEGEEEEAEGEEGGSCFWKRRSFVRAYS
jgi:hypothetical protein